MVKVWIIFICIFVGSSALAKFEIPVDEKVLVQFGHCQLETLPANFHLFLWNIKKAEAKEKWALDFTALAQKSDVILIQEAMMDDYMPTVVQRQKGFCWSFATSFFGKDNVATGVMSGSAIIPRSIRFLRSPGREPIINTPKMSLITEYTLAHSRENLLVVNIHGLNFVTDRRNREQIEHVATQLRLHQGPIIFAGDFNSWNKDRLLHLDQILGPLGMKKQPLLQDERGLKLDHIYVRDLEVTTATLHTDIESSDHKPITAEFRLK